MPSEELWKNLRSYEEKTYNQILRLYLAGQGVIHAQASELERVVKAARAAAAMSTKLVAEQAEEDRKANPNAAHHFSAEVTAFAEWDCNTGLVVGDHQPLAMRELRDRYNAAPRKSEGLRDAAALIGMIYAPNAPKSAIYVLSNFDHFMNKQRDAGVAVQLGILGAKHKSQICSMDPTTGQESRRCIIIASSAPPPPLFGEMADFLFWLHVAEPTNEELAEVLKEVAEASGIDFTEQRLYELATACRGLTCEQSRTALSLCISEDKIDLNGPAAIQCIEGFKISKIGARTPALTYKPRIFISKPENVCGFERVMDDLSRFRSTMTKEAYEQKLDRSRGIAFLGAPGTAKSVMAEAAATVLDCPLLIADIGAMKNKHVGESEAICRETLMQAVGLGRCVLLLDEIDKAMGDAMSSGGDNGVSLGILGYFLSFMSRNQIPREKKMSVVEDLMTISAKSSYMTVESEVFIIMTMNRLAGLPPELLRRGRLDALYYTSLPEEEDRLNIFRAAFRKRGDVFPECLVNNRELFLKTEKWTGAEIDAIVADIRRASFHETKIATPTPEFMLKFIAEQATYNCEYQKHSKGYDEMLAEAKKIAKPVGYTPSEKRGTHIEEKFQPKRAGVKRVGSNPSAN